MKKRSLKSSAVFYTETEENMKELKAKFESLSFDSNTREITNKPLESEDLLKKDVKIYASPAYTCEVTETRKYSESIYRQDARNPIVDCTLPRGASKKKPVPAPRSSLNRGSSLKEYPKFSYMDVNIDTDTPNTAKLKQSKCDITNIVNNPGDNNIPNNTIQFKFDWNKDSGEIYENVNFSTDPQNKYDKQRSTENVIYCNLPVRGKIKENTEEATSCFKKSGYDPMINDEETNSSDLKYNIKIDDFINNSKQKQFQYSGFKGGDFRKTTSNNVLTDDEKHKQWSLQDNPLDQNDPIYENVNIIFQPDDMNKLNEVDQMTNKSNNLQLLYLPIKMPITMIDVKQNMLLRIIDEIKCREKLFVEELSETVPVYKYGIKNHSSSAIKSKSNSICDAIDNIYNKQKGFWKALKKQQNIGSLIKVFRAYMDLFEAYEHYFIINSTNTIIKAGDEMFQTELSLSSTFNQKLTHYKMSWERIVETLDDDDTNFKLAKEILEFLTNLLATCDKVMLLSTVHINPLFTDSRGELCDVRSVCLTESVITYLKDFSGYGHFLLRDRFKVIPHKMTFVTLLFEKIILFTTEINPNQLYYKDHIKMDDVRLLAKDEKNKSILKVEHYKKSKQFHCKVILQFEAKSVDIRDLWWDKIFNCLWLQNEKEKKKALLVQI